MHAKMRIVYVKIRPGTCKTPLHRTTFSPCSHYVLTLEDVVSTCETWDVVGTW